MGNWDAVLEGMGERLGQALARPEVVVLGGIAGPVGLLAAANAHVLAVSRGSWFRAFEDVPRAAWAIVPGARVYPEGRPSTPLAERLNAAVELLGADRVRRVLVSGDAAAPEGDEPEVMARYLEARGVPADRIVRDPAGARTLATMVAAKRLLEAAGEAPAAVICTQAFHLPRAVYLARAVGLQAWGFAADRRVDPYAIRNAAREAIARGRAWVDAATLRAGR